MKKALYAEAVENLLSAVHFQRTLSSLVGFKAISETLSQMYI
jgi:hypothetical protein